MNLSSRKLGRHLLLFLAVLLAACFSVRAELTEVTVEGKASGDLPLAREQALTDALREAVRKGVGVDVLSVTGVRDFVLEYDRVFAAAFGYVRDYTILSSGKRDDGFYYVKLRAQVGGGHPGMKDVLALRMLMSRKASPRVALEVDESIEGVSTGSTFARPWFEQAANEMQMNMVDIKTVNLMDERLAVRDSLSTGERWKLWRESDLSQKADYVIQVKVRGRNLGKPPYGALGWRFSLAVDMRVVCTDTGEVLASMPMEGKDLTSDLEAPDTAARDLVHKLLSGSQTKDYPGAWVLFRKLFVRWTTELDLGAIMRLELKEIAQADFTSLQKSMGGIEGINGVWSREFGNSGLSFIDVESRLDASGLGAAVVKALSGNWSCEHHTRHYLQFTRGVAQLAQQGVKPAALERGSGLNATSGAIRPQAKETPIPRWAWVLVGFGITGIFGGIFMLGRGSKVRG
jgi:hypothetical protein